MKVCFLFPGQGAQYPGMGQDLWEKSSRVRELFNIASETSGVDLKSLLFEGTEEELRQTDNTQLAVTLVNLACSAVLAEKGLTPQGCAGFSLGEYSALCEAGVIRLEDVFPIVKARGFFMEKASRKLDGPKGKSGMSAVIGVSWERAEEIVQALGRTDVFISNHTSPVQIVLGGTAEGLAMAEDAFDQAGFKKIIPLKVSGPFHTPLLKEAQQELDDFLKGYTFHDPVKPIYSNVTGEKITSGAEARRLCIEQVVSPVRWVKVEENLIKDGFDTFFETGPGSVLRGLMKAFNRELHCLPAGKLEDIEKITQG